MSKKEVPYWVIEYVPNDGIVNRESAIAVDGCENYVDLEGVNHFEFYNHFSVHIAIREALTSVDSWYETEEKMKNIMKNFQSFLFLLIIPILGFQCTKEDCNPSESEILKEDHRIRIVEKDNGQNTIGIGGKAIWTSKGVVYGTNQSFIDIHSVRLYDPESNKVKWIWNDWYEIRGGVFHNNSFPTSYYVYDEVFYFGDGRRTYGIDLNNGQTVLKEQWVDYNSHNHLTGLDHYLFRTGSDEHKPEEGVLLARDLNGTEWEEILRFPQPLDGVHTSGLANVQKEDGDIIIYFLMTDFVFAQNSSSRFVVGKYNFTKREMVKEVETVRTTDGGGIKVWSHPESNAMFVAVGPHIRAYSMDSLDLLWEREISTSIGQSEALIDKQGNLFLALGNGELMKRNLLTGKVEWSLEYGGNSHLAGLTANDQYLVGTKGKNLTVFDINTGDILLEISSWAYENEGNIFFWDGTTSFSSDGKTLMASDFRYLYEFCVHE